MMSAAALMQLVALVGAIQILAVRRLWLLLLLLHRVSNELVSLHHLRRHRGEAVLLRVAVVRPQRRSQASCFVNSFQQGRTTMSETSLRAQHASGGTVTFVVIGVVLVGRMVGACCSMQGGARVRVEHRAA